MSWLAVCITIHPVGLNINSLCLSSLNDLVEKG